MLYKTTLFYQIISSPFPPLGIGADRFGNFLHIGFLVRYLDSEALFAIAAALVVLLVSAIYEFARPAWIAQITVRGRAIGLYMLMFVLGVCYGLHYRLIFSMNVGLTLDLLSTNLSAVTSADIRENANLFDIAIFIAAPLAILWLVRALRRRNRTLGIYLFLACIVFILLSTFVAKDRLKNTVATTNPILFAASSFYNMRAWTVEDGENLSEEQLQSVGFIDPIFVDGPVENVNTAGHDEISSVRWNILLIVLESVGKDYVFKAEGTDTIPMPFLKNLAQEAWYFENHYSTANSSHRSIFSIFSGMYAMPTRSAFSLRGDLRIPSLNKLIGQDYGSFIVMPANEGSFFPLRYLRNNGLTDIMGFAAFPDIQQASHRHRNELAVMDRFLDRIDESPKPFFGSYFTFVGHAPYYDYGPEFSIFDDAAVPLTRYYNNLRLLDSMIERTFAKLEQTNLLDSTIVVIVGDHGEAFGKHADTWMHASSNYNEEFLVPALIYQPKLFKPRTITKTTSHIDFLPTILDAIGVPYNQRLLQGESVFAEENARKYVFMINHGGGVSSVSKQNIKVSYSANDKSCLAYDLNVDPDEMHAIDCSRYKDQYEALKAFVRFQRAILPSYNESIHREEDFFGQSHPGIR